ncbi:hypothetical protein [Desulfocicer niacini]
MDVGSQYSLIPYDSLNAVVPAAERKLQQTHAEIAPPSPEYQLSKKHPRVYISENSDFSPSRIYTSGSRLSAIEYSKIGALIDVYA